MSRLSLILLFTLITYAFNVTIDEVLKDKSGRECSPIDSTRKEEDYISEYEEDYCSSRKTNGDYTHCCLFEDTNGNYGCRGITDDEYENIVRFKKYLRDQVDDDDIDINCSSRFISITLLAVLALLF